MTEAERKEKLNELMNRISFALKDATLAQGFEIICKRISEMEKENEELKKEIEKLKEKHKEAFLKEIANHNKEIAELQKLFNEEHQRFNKYLEETLFLRGENDDLKKKLREDEEIESVSDFRWEENQRLKKENEDLKAQIEKMKCCENCKFWQDNDCIIEHDYDCKRWINTNTDDFWELAE